MSFGTRLREARLRHQLSQEALAEALGVSLKSVSRWELNQTLPQGYARLRLCRFLGLRPEDLFAEPEESAPMLLWTVPFLRNPCFTGRKAILETITRNLLPINLLQSASPLPLALSGLGGVGKTQVAIEYAYRYALEYRAVFWVAAETTESLMGSVQQIAEQLQLPERQATEQLHMVAAVQRWLATHSGWLLIGDNVEDLTLLRTILPSLPQGALLLTTRRQALGPFADSLEVLPMRNEEGVTLLLRRAKRLHGLPQDAVLSHEEILHAHPAAEEVAALLNGLPLALDQAGAYIEETGCSVAEYLHQCHQQRKHLLAHRGAHGGNHPASVTTTLRLSVERVGREHPAAADLLRVCAFLHAEAIPEELLLAGAPYLGPVLASVVPDLYQFNLTLAALRSASLISRHSETRTLWVHRLVQAVLQDQMEPAEVQLWSGRVIRMVHAAFPQVTHETWKQCERLLPHALVCAAVMPESGGNQEQADVSRKAGDYLYQRGQYQQAEPLLRQALCLQDHLSGPVDPQRATVLYSLGLLLREQGRREQAEELLQRALSIREQTLGTRHIEVSLSLNALADLYREQEKHEQAEALYHRALQIREHSLGIAHPEVATTLGNLATLYRDQGKYEQAEPLYQRALHIQEHTLGAEHPDLARLLNNLALLYYHQGKYELAEPLYQRALHIREQALGPDHPDVARPLNNLALLYYHQGKYAQAEALYQRILLIREQVLDPDHPNISYTLNGLATVSHSQGKYEQAERLYRRALDLREQALGPNHSALAHPLYNLGKLYREQGKYAQAGPLLQRSLSILECALGQEHPDVAFPLDGLASLYRDQKKYEQAEALYQRALHIREQHLGLEHPRTAEILCNQGTLCQKQGQDEQAEALFRQSLSILEQALGQEHPDLLDPLCGLAKLCRDQQRGEQAEVLYQRAFAISELHLGPAHPQTGEIQREYQSLLSQRSQASAAEPCEPQES